MREGSGSRAEGFAPSVGAGKQGVPEKRARGSRSGRANARTTSATEALSGVRELYAGNVRATYRERGGRFSVWDDASRMLMADVIFGVENDLEHRQVATAPSERHDVRALNAARLRLMRELGLDEKPWKDGKQ